MLKAIRKSAELLWNQLAGSPSNQATMSLHNYIFFQIKPFKDNDRGINHRDTVIKSMISLKRKKATFLITWNSTDIKFFVAIPKDFKQYFENTFYSSFPTSDLIEVPKMNFPINQEYIRFSNTGQILTKEEFTRWWSYMDPLNWLLSIYNTIWQNSKLELYFTYRFKRSKNIFRTLWNFAIRLWNIRKKEEEWAKEKIIEKKPDLYASFWYKIYCKDKYTTEWIRKNLKSAFSTFISNGKLKIKKIEKFMWMTHDNIVNFFHIPTLENFVKWLDYTLYRKLAYPTNLPTTKNASKEDLTILWKTDYRWEKITFGIKKEDKFRHMYIVGKTWTGKSTFIANMVKSDMLAGNWICLLDPHWELIDTVLEHIPTNRINDVILFDISDTDYPIWFNLLQADNEDEKNRIASWVVWAFYKLFENSWWPRLEYILRNVVLSIIDYPNATLMHILRVLVDKNFREEVVSHIKDAVILKFWKSEFDKWNDKQREEAIWPITNKVWQFLSSKLVRNIFWQPRTKLNLRKAMDESKIILVNLSKWKIWEDNAAMVWTLLVTKFQIDAMSRADIPEAQRKDFYLYIDEFQNFATSSFKSILSEARKYKLSLIIANQYISQIMPEIKDAIFWNVWTTVSFTLWYDDATIMTSQFKEMAKTNDLISLPKFTAYTRLMIDWISSDPFSMKTLPISTPEGSLELIDKIRKQSRQRYAMWRNQLEKLMDAWSNKSFSLQEKVAEKAKMEALGISDKEAENLQDIFIQQHLSYFTEFTIDWVEPDAIIFDTENHWHKAIRYSQPKWLDDQANLKFKKWSKVWIDNGGQVTMHVDIYQHQTIIIENNWPLIIWIGKKDEALQQIQEIYQSSGINQTFTLETSGHDFLKFCPNINKLEAALPKTQEPKKAIDQDHQSSSDWNHESSIGNFSIKDIKKWERYEWYIKLSYNYWMFVTVKWVEWLLHKNFIVAPVGVERKKYYNIGDKIKVKAMEFKEINGEQKVVRSQK